MRKAFLAGLLLPLIASAARQRFELPFNDKTDFAPGGTLRIEGSTGDVNIEGWDEPSVEIQAMRYKWSDHEDQAKAALARVQISKQLSGHELTITSTHQHFSGIEVYYRIRVPRNTKLMIQHLTGSVVVFGVEGDIDASAHIGDIFLQLPEPAKYEIDAFTKLGTVYSDFDGKIRHRRLGTGESLNPAADGTGGAHHISLRVFAGGITIQKVPAQPPLLSSN